MKHFALVWGAKWSIWRWSVCKMEHCALAWVQNVAFCNGLNAKWSIVRWLGCKMEHFAVDCVQYEALCDGVGVKWSIWRLAA